MSRANSVSPLTCSNCSFVLWFNMMQNVLMMGVSHVYERRVQLNDDNRIYPEAQVCTKPKRTLDTTLAWLTKVLSWSIQILFSLLLRLGQLFSEQNGTGTRRLIKYHPWLLTDPTKLSHKLMCIPMRVECKRSFKSLCHHSTATVWIRWGILFVVHSSPRYGCHGYCCK